jgi:hypothetical protein
VILFSAALALAIAALLILIAGWATTQVYLVVWSMAIAVLAAVFLLIGALLKRHLLFPVGGRAAVGPDLTPQGSPVSELAHAGATAFSAAPGHPVATPMVAAPPLMHHGARPPVPFPHPRPEQTTPLMRPPAPPGSDHGALGPEGIVLVVPGRRRFHLANCRQLIGREIEELTYAEAREEGFSPCTTCLPDMSARVADEPGSTGPAREEGERTAAMSMPTGPAASRTQAPSSGAGETGNTRPGDPKPGASRGGEDAGRMTPSDGPGARTGAPAVDDSDVTRVGGARGLANKDFGADPRSATPETARPETAPSEAARSEAARPEAAASETSRSGPAGSGSGQLDWFTRGSMQPPSPSAASPSTAARPTPGEAAEQESGAQDRTAESPSSSAPEPAAKGGWFSVDRSASKTAEPDSAQPDSARPTPADAAPEEPESGTAEPGTSPAQTTGSQKEGPQRPEPHNDKAPNSGTRSSEKRGSGTQAFRTPGSTTESADTTGEKAAAVPGGAKPEYPKVEGSKPGGSKPGGSKTEGVGTESTQPDDSATTGSRSVTAGDGKTAVARGPVAGTDPDELEDLGETTQPGRAGSPIPPIPAAPPTASAVPPMTSAVPTTATSAAPSSASDSVRQAGGGTRLSASSEASGGSGTAADSPKDGSSSGGGRKKDATTSAMAEEAIPSAASEASAKTGETAPRGVTAERSAKAEDDSADGERDDGETGIFAAVRPDAPRDIPAGSVRVMTGTRRYHSSECPLISAIDDGSIEVMTREEAEAAGLTHWSVCQTR